MSMSSVPWTSALVLSTGAIGHLSSSQSREEDNGPPSLDCQEEANMRRLRARILVDDPSDRTPAHAAEADRIACEHDAVGLGAIEALGLVAGAFERADSA